MKSLFNGYTVCVLALLVFISCNDNDIKMNPTANLVKIEEGYAVGAAAKVELWAEENLFAGYNKVYFALYDSTTGKRITDAHIHMHPEMAMMGGMKHGCPMENPEEEAINELFPASLSFIMPTSDMGSWKLSLDIHNHSNNKDGEAIFDISVANPSSSRMKSFVINSNEKIFVFYHFQEGMKVGINPFEVMTYKMTGGYDFPPVESFAVGLTPEMPSMGHGSPNNVNPVHVEAGHYEGQVNFTMTGGWRLNLELLQNGTSVQKFYFDVTLE